MRPFVPIIHSFLPCVPFLRKSAQATEEGSLALGFECTCTYPVQLYRPLDATSFFLLCVNQLCVHDEFKGTVCAISSLPFILIFVFPSFVNQPVRQIFRALQSAWQVRLSMLCGCIDPSMRFLSCLRGMNLSCVRYKLGEPIRPCLHSYQSFLPVFSLPPQTSESNRTCQLCIGPFWYACLCCVFLSIP